MFSNMGMVLPQMSSKNMPYFQPQPNVVGMNSAGNNANMLNSLIASKMNRMNIVQLQANSNVSNILALLQNGINPSMIS